jgi:hypothetical protein
VPVTPPLGRDSSDCGAAEVYTNARRPNVPIKQTFAPDFLSPIEPLDSRHHIEVPVAAQKRKPMLPAEGRNPKVIGGNRLPGLPQLDVDSCVVMRSFFGNVQHDAIADQTVQPPSIPGTVPRLRDPVPIFPYDYCRQR